ncbi:MAG: hypothetical protein HY824_05605 [Acidobacteria bacterium]|nr:hypothetical protein [Acidobacteriota bacterium]
MPKSAISVTLEAGNLTWLRARARAGGARSVSDVLDRLVTSARTLGAAGEARSVVGTIDVDSSDPLLLKADDAVRALFGESLGRPFPVKEQRTAYGGRPRKRRG